MFMPEDVLYEDNHLLVVNKRCGDLVQPDPNGDSALENEIKEWIKVRDNKPGNVFLGVVHRLDRPVSGVVLFAKTGKSLVRLNKMFKEREVKKLYWAILEKMPEKIEAELTHYITRDSSRNISRALDFPRHDAKHSMLSYKVLASSDRYHLAEVDLHTGRHHQIRAQFSKIGTSIKGDLKYGSKRSNPSGGISLHARFLEFPHPVGGQIVTIVAPVPDDDKLWLFFSDILSEKSMTKQR